MGILRNTFRLFWSLSKPAYQPLVRVLVFQEPIKNNLNVFRQAFGSTAVAPVLKSNAYGHGLSALSLILKDESLPFVCVDSLFEAEALKSHKFKPQVLIIGYSLTENILRAGRKFHFTVSSLEQLRELASRANRPVYLQVKIDTGMHRQGILPNDIHNVFEVFKKNPNLVLKGIFSHLGGPENMKLQQQTLKQISIWNETVKLFKKEFPEMEFWHLSASSGYQYLKKIDCNSARVGLGLYGIRPSEEFFFDVKPALRLETVVASVKEIDEGESVGYGFAFLAKRKTRLALVPAGYFEGVDRRLSNLGTMKLGEAFAQIAGRVSMNMSSLDITDIAGVKAGDTVEIISNRATDQNSVENLAKLCGTIPYEILVHLPQHLKRVII